MRVPVPARLVLGTVAACACAPAIQTRGVHPSGLQQATRAMAVAFREHQVPVVVADEAYGFVASGRFELEQAWGTQAIEQRVDCGETDEGTPRARLGVVWMEVEARLRPTGDALATARAGVSIGRRPTDVVLLGHGAVRIGDDTHDCGLTQAFTREILATAGVQGDVIDRPGDARAIAGRP